MLDEMMNFGCYRDFSKPHLSIEIYLHIYMVSTVFILCAKSRKHPPFCLPKNISTIFIHSLPRMFGAHIQSSHATFFFQFTLNYEIFSAKPTHQIISMQSLMYTET
ncbi:hypothetical protein ACJX0J_034710 [Zea mays]